MVSVWLVSNRDPEQVDSSLQWATALPGASVREPRASPSVDCLGTTGVGEPLEATYTARF